MRNKGFTPTPKMLEPNVFGVSLRSKRGFSIVEFLITIGISILVVILITYFARATFSFNLTSQASLNAQFESRKILNYVIGELRSASPSALGGYPIETAGTSSLIFYADINNDDNSDRIRYFFDAPNKMIKKGVVLAAGAPPSYNLGAETITTVMNDVTNASTTPLFDYFDKNYAGTTTPLAIPVNIASIRLVRLTVKVDKDINRSPVTMTFTSSASLRNLKDNL